jgi:hypothetical protein
MDSEEKRIYMQTYKKEYRQRPTVKAKQREYMQKYTSKPDVKQKLKEYRRDYMKEYFKNNPDKYQSLKHRIAEVAKIKKQNEKTEIAVNI